VPGVRDAITAHAHRVSGELLCVEEGWLCVAVASPKMVAFTHRAARSKRRGSRNSCR
jgi:hypothetical protein